MQFDKIYIVPAAHLALGGILGNNYGALHYGPMANLDLGIKLQNHRILFLGVGFKYNIPLVS